MRGLGKDIANNAVAAETRSFRYLQQNVCRSSKYGDRSSLCCSSEHLFHALERENVLFPPLKQRPGLLEDFLL